MNLLITETAGRAFLRVRGADAEAFLQGQLSNDLRRLTPGRAQLSSYSSAKGRMLAVLLLLRVDEDIFIELPRAIAVPTLARLKMFVLRARLTIELAEDVDALALLGADAPAMMAFFDLPVPEAPLECRRSATGLTVVRALGTLPRYTALGPREAIAALRAKVPAALFEPEGRLWRRADIEEGIPVVLPETRDHFVAQMANLDLLGGISFEKGCYTGQEIVARLHYLGQLKRRMFVARIDGAAPAPGTSVLAGNETQAVGEIVDAVDIEEGAAVASVVLQLAAAGRPLHVEGSGAALRITAGPPG